MTTVFGNQQNSVKTCDMISVHVKNYILSKTYKYNRKVRNFYINKSHCIKMQY